MPLAAVAAGVGIAGAAAQGIGTAIGSGGGGSQQVKLPPELEAQQLGILQTQMEQFEQESQRTSAAADAITQRANILNQVQQGLIPTEEGLRQITTTNQQLADKFGDEILGQIGDLSKDLGLESMIRDKTQELLSQPLEEFKDPTIERQIGEGQRLLEERLNRQLGPDWKNSDAGIRALNAFNQSAIEARSTASRQMREEKINTLTGATGIAGSIIGARTGAGQLMFEGRQSAISNLYAGMSSGQTGLGYLGQGAQLGASALEYGQYPMQSFQQFGSQNISKDTSRYLTESGAGGMFNEFTTYGEAKKRGSLPYTEGWGKNYQDKGEYYQNYQYKR